MIVDGLLQFCNIVIYLCLSIPSRDLVHKACFTQSFHHLVPSVVGELDHQPGLTDALITEKLCSLTLIDFSLFSNHMRSGVITLQKQWLMIYFSLVLFLYVYRYTKLPSHDSS